MIGERSTIIGLTGSIGMGKTTTAKMFANMGIPVWDADKSVHHLYSTNKEVLEQISILCPDATKKHSVDRLILKEWIVSDPRNLKRLENVIHPYIADDRETFLKKNKGVFVVLDIPLLYEMGLDHLVDYVIVVSAPADMQRQRVLERKTMTQEQFEIILAKQMPDVDKRKKADFVIKTTSFVTASKQVEEIIKILKEQTCA